MGVFGRGHVRGHVRFGSDHVTIKKRPKSRLRDALCTNGGTCAAVGLDFVPSPGFVPQAVSIAYRRRDLLPFLGSKAQLRDGFCTALGICTACGSK